MKYVLEDKKISQIQCPEPNCEALLAFDKIYQLCLKYNDMKLFEMYDRRLTDQRCEKTKGFISCTYAGCDSGQIHDPGTTDQRRLVCIKCKRTTCSFHKVPWHHGLTCDQYDQSKLSIVDNLTETWLQLYAKRCPQCQSLIQKKDGCDMMSCEKCKHKFCWICLADYKLIMSVGLHRHQETCSHHPKQKSISQTNRSKPDQSTIL
ncbi:unnamed protein product [Rotaria sp. Silwood2]|nr:unnamed protein product [Rotaria sp. Silwood2]CAF2886383.1 unnamed protein product [Rotaria sp. Silwood2]CAF3307783.1 unnamed protein product [Rotaria sp. Silwood2]CAF4108655.1 unnamed protein product [Rotaria sp. Silwood2]CAF4378181.1 unnamed protein product [Rotaria sp. Silwood2]